MLTRLFCDIDDFCQIYIPQWEATLIKCGDKKRCRKRLLNHSEIISIIVHYHQSGYRTFKWYYQNHVSKYLRTYFPTLPSYGRFIELTKEVIMPITAFMKHRCQKGKGIAFIDSTPLRVCTNLRIPRHKTFKDIAGRSKSSTGWFYGFKLHLVVDDKGEILSFKITKGNVDDRKPVPTLMENYIGKLFADKGYISQALTQLLSENNVELITTLKKNMKPRLMKLFDKLMLRKRSIIETINDQLKNINNIEHSRHRSLTNCMINVVAGLIAYSYQEKKPSLNIRIEDFQSLVIR